MIYERNHFHENQATVLVIHSIWRRRIGQKGAETNCLTSTGVLLDFVRLKKARLHDKKAVVTHTCLSHIAHRRARKPSPGDVYTSTPPGQEFMENIRSRGEGSSYLGIVVFDMVKRLW